jgi:hypothetical protein
MSGTDKLLAVIVGGAVLLVGVALALMLLRPEPAYQSDGAPEGVAHNYLLALRKEEYQRAYAYLSDSLPGYPDDLDEFEKSIDRNVWKFPRVGDPSLTVESSEISGTKAVVTIREIGFIRRGLFDSSQSISTFDIKLEQRDTDWKIVDAGRYFAWCWSYTEGCD